jgi:hypothetical protein
MSPVGITVNRFAEVRRDVHKATRDALEATAEELAEKATRKTQPPFSVLQAHVLRVAGKERR